MESPAHCIERPHVQEYLSSTNRFLMGEKQKQKTKNTELENEEGAGVNLKEESVRAEGAK